MIIEHQDNQTNTVYLLTGVAGNLGSSVAAQLLEDRKKERGLVFKGDPTTERVPEEVVFDCSKVKRELNFTRIHLPNPSRTPIVWLEREHIIQYIRKAS